jgi:tRNA(fMet)-specific endonuclease VapC
MKFILDTDTLIYWLKDIPEVVKKITYHEHKTISASAISRAELYYGAYRSQYVEKNLKAIQKLSDTIKFLPIEEDIEKTYGHIKAELQRTGNVIDDMDILIAATAIATDKVLVTNNEKHFKRIRGLKIENWTY